MDKQKDILLDENNDLLIQNGDLVIGESEEQEIRCIVQAVKNDYKQFPELGVNLIEMLDGSTDIREIKQIIKLNLRADGKENKKINIKNGAIEITD